MIVEYINKGKLRAITFNLVIVKLSIAICGYKKFSLRFEISWGWS